MSRSEAVRQEVLRLDDHRCQLTGSRGDEVPLNVHHWHPLGIGGSEALDTVENGITTSQSIHLDGVHPGVSVPTVRIVHWDRSDKENGLVVERRDGIADEWEEWPKEELWFYKRQDAEMLEKEIEMVRQVQLIESKHAQIMAHIWENYSLLSDAVSPEQFVAGLGLDSNRAKGEAKAAKWIEDNGLTWPDGVNVKKVLLIASAFPEPGLYINMKTMLHSHGFGGAPELLNQAVDMSYSDLHKELIKKGLKTATMKWYVVVKRMPVMSAVVAGWSRKTLYVRSRDYERMLAKLGPHDHLLEINAFRAGIRWDRKAQKLYDREGKEIHYETWEKE